MVLVKRFDVKNKKTLLVVLTILFVSCGGGSGTVAVVNNATQAVSNLTSGVLLLPAVY
jgi:hypothetical protein